MDAQGGNRYMTENPTTGNDANFTLVTKGLEYVSARLAYTKVTDQTSVVKVYPPSSGLGTIAAEHIRVEMPIFDCRPLIETLSLDNAGFEFVVQASNFDNFYDAGSVRELYYPEVIELLRSRTEGIEVFVFDHNVRNQTRAERGESGVREPVDGAHNDYTVSSGPRRVLEILEENDALGLAGKRAALTNVWRPIVGPVQDFPIAICDARTALADDFIPTRIEHFLEDNLDSPHLVGEIYNFSHNSGHKWFYVSNMQPHEALLLKCYDSMHDNYACFTGHTGFRNPESPPDAEPRQSIEARTLVIFDE
jgi:hypothetical protein